MRRDDLVDVLITAIYPDRNTHASCRVVISSHVQILVHHPQPFA
jgi:hypothetical protein